MTAVRPQAFPLSLKTKVFNEYWTQGAAERSEAERWNGFHFVKPLFSQNTFLRRDDLYEFF